MKDQDHLSLKIADIVLSVFSEWPMEVPTYAGTGLEESYQDFLCTEEPEVVINAGHGGIPHIPLRHQNRVFDSESLWSLYQVPACSGTWRNVVVLRSRAFGPLPYRIAVFDADFSRGDVYNRMPESADTSDGLLAETPRIRGDRVPFLDFPLSEVLMVCLLAQGRGLMVHSCGIDDGGRGYLFAGNSTHGKTTMARLFSRRREEREKGRKGERERRSTPLLPCSPAPLVPSILNDDRIVLRQRECHFWMYGTPWHGDYTAVSPQGVPLEKIFFLQHADANGTKRVRGAVAASMLLARSFLPLWDAEGMRFTLDFCTQLVAHVPCYELGFVPDDTIVDFVRGFNH